MSHLITSQQWWDVTKNCPMALISWLKDQYHGEVTAAVRIREQFGRFAMATKDWDTVERIAKEEELHAKWVGQLLVARGVSPAILEKEERYWDSVIKDIQTVEDVAAIAHHAENMRLERIQVIVQDPESPKDVAAVFRRILPMELGHEKLFARLSTPEAIHAHKGNHELGRKVLGLVA